MKNEKNSHKKWRNIATVFLMIFGILLGSGNASASSFASDYRHWSQGGSDYPGMREVGCLITAQAKLLYETNVIRDGGFNPDRWYEWLLNNGYIASANNLIMRDHRAPVYFAQSRGKNLEYLGFWDASDNQLWYNINQGYYTIVNVPNHFVMIDNALSKQTGVLYVYDSFNDRGTITQQKLSRYGSRSGGHVFKSNNNPSHTHSYSSQVITQPTCTTQGSRRYQCACGASYSEAIPALGHSYRNEIVPPAIGEKGYTLHKCSRCGYSYKDAYVPALTPNSDGWYYCNNLPSNVSPENSYEIQYANTYERIQQSSPGAGWTNAGVAKTEWRDSGNTYFSGTDLPEQISQNRSRFLVSSIYYHFCGPNGGQTSNYYQDSTYVHYDWISAKSVIPIYAGMSGSMPYYYLDWNDGGGRVWCRSGVTCDGKYGSHNARSQFWFKQNEYQDREKILHYRYTKSSGWTSAKDAAAKSVQIRFRIKETNNGNSGVVTPGGSGSVSTPSVKPPVSAVSQFTLKLNKASFSYNGKARKPKLTVYANGKKVKTSMYRVTYKNNKKIGTATVTVKGKGIYKNYTGTAQYRIIPNKTSFKSVKSLKKGKLSLKWKASKGQGYQIQYSPNKKFSSGTTSKTIFGKKKNSVTLKGLRSRKKYYVRIRTYQKVSSQIWYSDWSKVSRIKIK